MIGASSLKVPLRSPDKLLLLAGLLTLAIAGVFLLMASSQREAVVTETRTATWLTTQTTAVTERITTLSFVTRTVTMVTYVPVTIVLGTSSVARTTTYTYVSESKVTLTQVTYSRTTLTQESLTQITSARLVLERLVFPTVLWIGLGIVLFGLTYYRVHEYRTRLHIYYEILKYVSSPKIASHIMRKCNLETGKFNRYVNELQMKGFVNVVQRDDTKEYVATDKSHEYLRDEKLAKFITELC